MAAVVRGRRRHSVWQPIMEPTHALTVHIRCFLNSLEPRDRSCMAPTNLGANECDSQTDCPSSFSLDPGASSSGAGNRDGVIYAENAFGLNESLRDSRRNGEQTGGSVSICSSELDVDPVSPVARPKQVPRGRRGSFVDPILDRLPTEFP